MENENSSDLGRTNSGQREKKESEGDDMAIRHQKLIKKLGQKNYPRAFVRGSRLNRDAFLKEAEELRPHGTKDWLTDAREAAKVASDAVSWRSGTTKQGENPFANLCDRPKVTTAVRQPLSGRQQIRPMQDGPKCWPGRGRPREIAHTHESRTKLSDEKEWGPWEPILRLERQPSNRDIVEAYKRNFIGEVSRLPTWQAGTKVGRKRTEVLNELKHKKAVVGASPPPPRGRRRLTILTGGGLLQKKSKKSKKLIKRRKKNGHLRKKPLVKTIENLKKRLIK